MCTGGCAKCLGCTLLPLSTIAFLSNILLFFPGGKEIDNIHHLSQEVWYFGGILGSGFMMLLPANMLLDLKNNDCCGCCGLKSCGKRFAMFSSIIFAVIGFLGAAYSFVISLISIRKGPKCLMDNNEWGYPFQNGDYLSDKSLRSKCREPENVVSWNLTLFSILLVIAVIQMVLCAIQVVNGLLGTVCGNCCRAPLPGPQPGTALGCPFISFRGDWADHGERPFPSDRSHHAPLLAQLPVAAKGCLPLPEKEKPFLFVSEAAANS
ncbi:transmembrane 4 L6 family member 4-like [Pteronotus mesoamericanus]|uniref:transmembrane 4 L6 family member 4-like n=1 Tax=Pteronotus mesoamericanus TaxID=1884717 RepID=UPI0023EA9F70|nr:transmembrane 4 L6 family member 4-like [Pteronotus parnellii mesoamericanus]